MPYRIFLSGIILLLAFARSNGQTTVNPDISLIGDIRAFSHDDKTRPQERRELNLNNPEIELMISGYVNPYVRADAVFAWHGEEHNAEIEEAYATILRGLPLGMNLRAGKYLLEFGRLNSVHPHAWSFIKRPLPHTAFFGEEGLSDMALRTSFLLPTGSAYTEVMGAVLKGDALIGHGHADGEEHPGEETDHDEDIKTDFGFFGRLGTSWAVSEFGELAVGGSVLNSVHEAHSESEQYRSWIIGGDLKYKNKPNRNRSLQVECEFLYRIQEHEVTENLKSFGGYAYLDYRFRQQYNAGGIFEFLREDHAHEHLEGDFEIERVNTWRAGVFLGFMPVEETSLVRLAGHWIEPDEGDGYGEITLQLVFSLGPHQPHNF